MPAAGTSSRFRRRNLNFKAHIAILREGDLDETSQEPDVDGDGIKAMKTGVDAEEEKEHHLQAVIKASQAAAKGIAGGKLAQTFIPTPDATRSNVPYNELYREAFAQPATYIRFSSTVEDCTGTTYCMDEHDAEFLDSINARVEDAGSRAGKKCSEDQFEAVMNAYEETSQARQPFASVDGTPVLEFAEMVAAFDEIESDDLDETARTFAEEIYRYWKERKIERGSKTLMPKLKTLNMDQPTKDADDTDPYVCFRRREVKQMRRTRGRDNQVIERLKKLRRELEDGRQLLSWVKNREVAKQEETKLSRHIFEQRAAVRDLKRNLNITEDDEELLINQRTPKRPRIEHPRPQGPPRVPGRPDPMMSLPDFDTIQWSDRLKQRADAIEQMIGTRLKDFEKWNGNFVDRTQDFLEGVWLPQDEFDEPQSQWVSMDVMEEPKQQPTPPASVSEGDPMDEDKPDEDRREETPEEDKTQIRWITPPDTDSSEDQNHPRIVYRRRRGRGGMMLDQRRLRGRPQKHVGAKTRELYKYDVDSGEEDDVVERLESTDTKFFRLRQHLRNFGNRQRQGEQNGGYHSRSGSMISGGQGVSRR